LPIEALNVIQDECIPNVKSQERFIKDFLSTFTNVISIRGLGMFWGIQFDEKYNLEDLRLRLLNKGYITCTSRNNTLRLTPPLTIHRNVLKKSLQTIYTEIHK
jgi:acetylornithine/succinyldiaminopimelate/putrescine aminotransferase